MTAISSGTLAYVVRRRANERYADYERTADPELIASYYDDAARLDRRAAGLFITAEVAFITAVYLGFFVAAEPPAVASTRTAGNRQPAAAAGDQHGPRLRPVPGGLTFCWRW